MTLDDLIDDVALDVPDAPRASIRDTLRWAQRELAREGNAWVVSDEPVIVAADTAYAELEPPVDAEPVRILSVEVDGRAIHPGSDYRQVSPTRIELRRTPDASTLRGRLAVAPTSDAPDLPLELLSQHAETLKHGARYRLLMLPQAWRNPEIAMLHQRYWLAGISDAKRLASYGFQAGGARVRTRRFI